MTIKSDKWIIDKANKEELIVPFFMKSINELSNYPGVTLKIPSYGLSSYGYDVRLGRNFTVFKNKINNYAVDVCRNGNEETLEMVHRYDGDFIDICNFDKDIGQDIKDVDWIIMPPHSFILGHSEEKIKVPRNVSVVCMGKSTIARNGIIVTVTPLESDWSGFITLEITNTTDLPVKLYSGIGITQLQFFESDEQCLVSYADRKGKYQNQDKVPVSPIL